MIKVIDWIHNKSNKNLFRSRDVTFNEDMGALSENYLGYLTKESD